MKNKLMPLEKAIRIIEWEGGSDFKSQLEYMAACCGWDVIALYAQDRAERQALAKERGRHSPELRKRDGLQDQG